MGLIYSDGLRRHLGQRAGCRNMWGSLVEREGDFYLWRIRLNRKLVRHCYGERAYRIKDGDRVDIRTVKGFRKFEVCLNG